MAVAAAALALVKETKASGPVVAQAGAEAEPSQTSLGPALAPPPAHRAKLRPCLQTPQMASASLRSMGSMQQVRTAAWVPPKAAQPLLS